MLGHRFVRKFNEVPVGMIFVANQNGSHNWREAMKTEDFLQGTELLWHTVCDYDKPESER